MTIAACYLSPEGLVFGADSTSSVLMQSGPGTVAFHFYNHNQKVFQIGEKSTLGVVTWGLGGLGNLSHRTLLAQLSDDLQTTPPATMAEVADRWSTLFWGAYITQLQNELTIFRALQAKLAFDPAAVSPAANSRSKQEEDQFQSWARDLVVGFCLGGYVMPGRMPEAFTVMIAPNLSAAPTPLQVQNGGIQWFGVPNLINRLMNGYDLNIIPAILATTKWKGSPQELIDLLDQHRLAHAILPIRDAIDYVFTSIYSTIKAMKFSSLAQVCGGPIEIAVITTDREFRWVRHKAWDSAISEG